MRFRIEPGERLHEETEPRAIRRALLPEIDQADGTDLKKYPQYLNDLKEQGIDFPDISAPREIKYELKGKLGELFTDSMEILTNDVKYFRYQAVLALKEQIRDEYYPQARIVSISLAGILRNLYERLFSA